MSEVRDLKTEARAVRATDEELAEIAEILRHESRPLPASEQARQIERRDAVRQFTGGLAHNLNNLMTVILCGTETMFDELGSQNPLRTVSRRTLSATDRAAGLMRRLMIYADCSHSVFGKVEVDRDIEAICRDLQAGCAARYHLGLALAAPGATIRINQRLFAEVVGELVRNAQAAMPQGGAIRLSTEFRIDRGTPGKRSVVVAVTDNGVGMDEETRRRVCEPFFTTRETGQGIGLGLSLGDGAVRGAGGVLNVHSRVGFGTVVELHLPVVD